MKKNEIKEIAIVFVILLIITAIIIVVRINSREEEKSNNNENTLEEVQTEEFVIQEEDGIRVNTSEKIKEEKEIDGLKITEINIEEKDNETIFTANVTNTTNETKGDYAVNIIAKDKNGNEIKTIGGYINAVEAGGKTVLRIKTSYDFANTYDIDITKDKKYKRMRN